MKRWFVILLVCECLAGTGFLGFVFQQRIATADEYDRQAKLAQEEGKRIREQTVLAHNEKVSAGENFKAALEEFGLRRK